MRSLLSRHPWARGPLALVVIATMPIWIVPLVIALVFVLVGVSVYDAIWGEE